MEHTQDLYDRALRIASEAHSGQKDRGGKPYILHPIRVAERCKTRIAKVVALLHDVVEDTDVTLEDLLEAGFPAEVVSSVGLLTRHDGEDYQEYIERVAESAVATEVKIADLCENMDITRLKTLTKNDLERLRKYHRAYRFLSKKNVY